MVHQIDCFKIQIFFFKYFGIWTKSDNKFRYYKYYSKVFVGLFNVLYVFLLSINFIFIERHLDKVVEELILYLTVISVTSKVFTFVILHEHVDKILSILESDWFQSNTLFGSDKISETKNMNKFYWKMFASVSVTSNASHALVPLILHLSLGTDLYLPVCSYDFIPDEIKDTLIYPLYFYQIIGIHISMWCNVNIDSFFLGIMNLIIAQLDILNDDLRNVTQKGDFHEELRSKDEYNGDLEEELYMKLRRCIIHFSKVAGFCALVQDTFSVTLFFQFNIASYVICVCLFRLNLPLTPSYFIFLSMYIMVMVLQILIPCWFGQQITDKSRQLAVAVYNCDWLARQRRFKINLRLLVERAARPLSITGGKIFPLLLTTFTSIANSAYSFYTLLRNVQTEQ